MNSRINLLFCIDHRFISPLGIFLHSIAVNNPSQQFNVHIYTEEIELVSELLISKISKFKNLNILVHDIREVGRYKSLVDNQDFILRLVKRTLTLSSLFRIIAIEELANIVDKILYLDADMICLSSLDQLCNINIENCVLAAVNEVGQDYYNSGMMYINSKEWLKEQITEKTLAYLISNGQSFKFPDQDALNHITKGKVNNISRKYNCTTYKPIDALEDIIIIHYATSIKPWKYYYKFVTDADLKYLDYMKAYEPNRRKWFSIFKSKNVLWYPESSLDYKFLAIKYISRLNIFKAFWSVLFYAYAKYFKKQ